MKNNPYTFGYTFGYGYVCLALYKSLIILYGHSLHYKGVTKFERRAPYTNIIAEVVKHVIFSHIWIYRCKTCFTILNNVYQEATPLGLYSDIFSV